MINWKKYSKEDRKFLINLSISNRDYCKSIALFIYSTLISVSALMISLYSIGVSISGLSKLTIYIGIGLLILIGVIWIFVWKNYRKIVKNWIPKLNNQYQDIHKTIHPELFGGGGYYY